MPDEIYNLGAQSHVRVSFECPEYTAETTGIGALRILESIKRKQHVKDIKFFQASTSELFGKVAQTPQNENSLSPTIALCRCKALCLLDYH